MEVFNDEYPDLNIFMTYLLYTYRNSIGDVSPPIYTYWLTETETNPGISWTMIIIIWTVWFINTWINLIIMLNFLIALIGQSYDKVMAEEDILIYEHKSLLNNEYQLIMQSIYSLKRFDTMVISYDTKKNLHFAN